MSDVPYPIVNGHTNATLIVHYNQMENDIAFAP